MIISFFPGAGGNRYVKLLSNLDWEKPSMSYDQYVQEPHRGNRYLHDATAISNMSKDAIILTHNMNSQFLDQCFPSVPITFIKGDLKKCLRRQWILAGHQIYKDKKLVQMHDRIQHYKDYKDDKWPDVYTLDELESLPKKILDEINADFQKNNSFLHDSVIPKTLRSLTEELISKAESAYEAIQWHVEYYKKYPVDFSKNCHTVVDIENDQTKFSQVMRQELARYTSDIFDEVWQVVNV